MGKKQALMIHKGWSQDVFNQEMGGKKDDRLIFGHVAFEMWSSNQVGLSYGTCFGSASIAHIGLDVLYLLSGLMILRTL